MCYCTQLQFEFVLFFIVFNCIFYGAVLEFEFTQVLSKYMQDLNMFAAELTRANKQARQSFYRVLLQHQGMEVREAVESTNAEGLQIQEEAAL